jgi:hypothetical protein
VTPPTIRLASLWRSSPEINFGSIAQGGERTGLAHRGAGAREQRPDNHSKRFREMRGSQLAIFSTTQHPDAAARFVAYLTSPAADRLLIEEASQLPYRRGLASDPRFAASLERWPTLATYVTYGE